MCTGPVIERTLEQIRRCDVGSWFNQKFPDRARAEFVGQRIPTLDEVFERYGQRANYYVETKNPESAPGMEEKLLELLEKHELRRGAIERRQVLIQSFSEESLRKLHALDELPLAAAAGARGTPEPESDLSAPSCGRCSTPSPSTRSAIGPARGTVDHASGPCGARAGHAGARVHGEPDVREMERLWNMGVDGVFTDFPDRLREMLARG
jgi:glycerophosphoryl diester phosphodiesterase